MQQTSQNILERRSTPIQARKTNKKGLEPPTSPSLYIEWAILNATFLYLSVGHALFVGPFAPKFFSEAAAAWRANIERRKLFWQLVSKPSVPWVHDFCLPTSFAHNNTLAVRGIERTVVVDGRRQVRDSRRLALGMTWHMDWWFFTGEFLSNGLTEDDGHNCS